MTTFFCTSCNAQVQLVLLKKYDYHESESDRYTAYMGHCAVCARPAIMRAVEVDVDDFVVDAQLYPPPTKLVANLPTRVGESYGEAHKCASAQAWLATAVMVRRTLEAIGKEFDPTARNLFVGMRVMKDSGVISEELWNWGEALRFLGNTGAHPTGEQVSMQDAQDALEFLNAIIQNIYVLRPKFTAMQKRRPVPQKTTLPVTATAPEAQSEAD